MAQVVNGVPTKSPSGAPSRTAKPVPNRGPMRTPPPRKIERWHPGIANKAVHDRARIRAIRKMAPALFAKLGGDLLTDLTKGKLKPRILTGLYLLGKEVAVLSSRVKADVQADLIAQQKQNAVAIRYYNDQVNRTYRTALRQVWFPIQAPTILPFVAQPATQQAVAYPNYFPPQPPQESSYWSYQYKYVIDWITFEGTWQWVWAFDSVGYSLAYNMYQNDLALYNAGYNAQVQAAQNYESYLVMESNWQAYQENQALITGIKRKETGQLFVVQERRIKRATADRMANKKQRNDKKESSGSRTMYRNALRIIGKTYGEFSETADMAMAFVEALEDSQGRDYIDLNISMEQAMANYSSGLMELNVGEFAFNMMANEIIDRLYALQGTMSAMAQINANIGIGKLKLPYHTEMMVYWGGRYVPTTATDIGRLFRELSDPLYMGHKLVNDYMKQRTSLKEFTSRMRYLTGVYPELKSHVNSLIKNRIHGTSNWGQRVINSWTDQHGIWRGSDYIPNVQTDRHISYLELAKRQTSKPNLRGPWTTNEIREMQRVDKDRAIMRNLAAPEYILGMSRSELRTRQAELHMSLGLPLPDPTSRW